MTLLNQLIQELCPDGVEYKAISECVQKVNNIKWSECLNAEFRYIDLTSVDRDTNCITDTQKIKAENAPSRAQQIVKEGDILLGTTRPMLKRYCMIDKTYDGQICSTGFCVLRAKDTSISTRWLYHQIASSAFFAHVEKFQKGAGYPAISDADVRSYKIPLPPLPVQSEIVKILDNFTELTARKKQYSEYLNILIDKNRFSNPSRMKLGELFEFRNGLSKGKDFFGKGTSFIRYTDVYNNRILHKEDISSLVECTPSELEKLKVTRGDVLFTRTSETAEDVGWSSVMLDDIGACVFNGFTIRATPKTDYLLPEYCAYCFSTNEFRQYVTSHCAFTTRASLTGKTLAEYDFVLPSIAEQQRIVSILDKLYLLCNSLTSGLPAEIAARQKQYEYYRDKLLTFKERSA